MSEERDLLFTALALQLGDVHASRRSPRPRASVAGEPKARLLASGRVTGARLADLEATTEKVLVAFDGDAARALAALPYVAVSDAKALLGAASPSASSLEPVTSSDPHLPGPEVPGRYVELTSKDGAPRELTRGGGARVQVMRDEVIGREIALKVLDGPGTPADHGEAFLREARLCAKLDHPVVTPVFEIGLRPDGAPYWTRRFVHGTTLLEAIRGAKTLEERLRLVPAFVQLCQCLASAHTRGIVHKDLHSNIVLLGEFGEVYLVEWRRAGPAEKATTRAAVESLSSSTPTGAPSLQQVLGTTEPLDEAGDVWGLGSMLFEVLTGAPLPSVGAPPAAALRGGPRELAAVCTKALAPERAARYSSVEALAHDVDAWLTGRRVAALTYGSFALMRRFVRKRLLWVATVGALLSAVAVGVGAGVLSIRAERAQGRRFAELFLGDVADTLAQEEGTAPLASRIGLVAAQHYERTGGLASASAPEQLRLGHAFARLCAQAATAARVEEASRLCALAREAQRRVSRAPGVEAQDAVLLGVEVDAAQSVLAFRVGDRARAAEQLGKARAGAAALGPAGPSSARAWGAVNAAAAIVTPDAGS